MKEKDMDLNFQKKVWPADIGGWKPTQKWLKAAEAAEAAFLKTMYLKLALKK